MVDCEAGCCLLARNGDPEVHGLAGRFISNPEGTCSTRPLPSSPEDPERWPQGIKR